MGRLIYKVDGETSTNWLSDARSSGSTTHYGVAVPHRRQTPSAKRIGWPHCEHLSSAGIGTVVMAGGFDPFGDNNVSDAVGEIIGAMLVPLPYQL